jgi:hypothetical protein
VVGDGLLAKFLQFGVGSLSHADSADGNLSQTACRSRLGEKSVIDGCGTSGGLSASHRWDRKDNHKRSRDEDTSHQSSSSWFLYVLFGRLERCRSGWAPALRKDTNSSPSPESRKGCAAASSVFTFFRPRIRFDDNGAAVAIQGLPKVDEQAPRRLVHNQPVTDWTSDNGQPRIGDMAACTRSRMRRSQWYVGIALPFLM